MNVSTRFFPIEEEGLEEPATPRYLVVVFLVAMTATAVLTLDWFRSYATETALLAYPRDARSSVSEDRMAANVTELPRTLNFYETLLRENRDVTDPWAGLAVPDRRAAWADHVSAERVGGSDIVRLSVAGDTMEGSSALSRKVVATLDEELGRIYGRDTTIFVETVDGPYTEARLEHVVLWAVTSVLGGILFVLVLFFIIRSVDPTAGRGGRHAEKRVSRHPHLWDMSGIIHELGKQQTSPEPVMPYAKPLEKMVAKQSEEPSSESEEPDDAVRPVTLVAEEVATATVPRMKETPIRESVSSAPSNLPFAEGEFSWEAQLGTDDTVTSETGQPTEKRAVSGVGTGEQDKETAPAMERSEPTEEELKRRLNQLLRGEL